MMEYVYVKSSGYISKRPITRQTEKTIWYKVNDVCEQSVLKSKLETNVSGDRWSSTYIYYKNEKIEQSYDTQEKRRDFLRKIESLQNCTDESIWDAVLAIELK